MTIRPLPLTSNLESNRHLSYHGCMKLVVPGSTKLYDPVPIFTKVRRTCRKDTIKMVFTKVRRRSVTSLLVVNLRFIQAHLTLRLKQIIVNSNTKELVVNTTRLLYVKLLKFGAVNSIF